jgi:D-apiose dehydrogenase
VELRAACDLDIERARRAAPNAYTSPEEMLEREELDFVDIATRPESHLALVRMAAARKLGIICQKPMAPTWEDCKAMADIATVQGVLLMIHENWRWQPWYRAAREIIAAGTIGNVLAYRMRSVKRDGLGPGAYPEQPYFRQMPRLIVFEVLVHHLDTARFLFGEVNRLYAQLRRNNSAISGEDQAHLLLTHESGLIGAIDGHRFLNTDPVAGPVLGEAWIEGDQDLLRLSPAGDLITTGGVVWKNNATAGYRGDSVLATQEHFVQCLRSGKTPESHAREYLKTVRLVEAAYRSAQDNQVISLGFV